MSNFELFGTRLLVKQQIVKKEEKEAKKIKGLYQLPGNENNPQERLFKGEVMYIGDECKKVNVGQIISFDKVQDAPYKVGDEVFEMVDESAVIGCYK